MSVMPQYLSVFLVNFFFQPYTNIIQLLRYNLNHMEVVNNDNDIPTDHIINRSAVGRVHIHCNNG